MMSRQRPFIVYLLLLVICKCFYDEQFPDIGSPVSCQPVITKTSIFEEQLDGSPAKTFNDSFVDYSVAQSSETESSVVECEVHCSSKFVHDICREEFIRVAQDNNGEFTF